MGTPAYMAPEQARARWDEVDARTDLWAVGATMFKLLTGRVVHMAETINEQLLAAMTQPAPPIATLVPTAPIPVLQVVDKALAFNKDDRWVNARGMQQAIRDAYQAIAGVPAASARLSFDDGEGTAVAHADTIAVSKVPTSLTAAHDSASFGTRRPRSFSKLGWLVTLGALAAGGYWFLSQGKVTGLPAILGGADAGLQALGVADNRSVDRNEAGRSTGALCRGHSGRRAPRRLRSAQRRKVSILPLCLPPPADSVGVPAESAEAPAPGPPGAATALQVAPVQPAAQRPSLPPSSAESTKPGTTHKPAPAPAPAKKKTHHHRK